ncbi:MAG: hypothetical protein ACI85U_001344, partial [Candidatus Promineifilaceae bacterium]
MSSKTIDDVINGLAEIIAESEKSGSRLGYFPALYRMVTIRVKEGIVNGEFENGARMEELDVIFATRYLDAYQAWSEGRPCSKSWQIAFEAVGSWRYIVLQHLFVGMNAHINLDLAIAAAEVAPGESIHELKNDFQNITNILNDLTTRVQKDIADVWPLLRLLSKWKRFGDWVSALGMKVSRNIAWGNAVELALADKDSK